MVTSGNTRVDSAAKPRSAYSKVALFILLFYLYSVFLSPYISSWLPSLAGYPVGAMVREVAIVIFLVYFCAKSFKCRIFSLQLQLIIYFILIAITLTVLFFTEGTLLQYVIGVNSFLAFPAIYVFLHCYSSAISAHGLQQFVSKINRHVGNILVLLALIGVIDVVTDGALVVALGYNSNYGGENFTLITTYNDAIRANAGVGDALAFGYLMSVGVILFFFRIKKGNPGFASNFIGLIICTIAAILSLTRGAIIATALTYVFFLLNLRHSWLLLLAFMISIIILMNTSYSEILLGRFTDSDDGSARSSELRIVMALASLDYLSQNHWGVGIGTQGAGNLLAKDDLRLNTDSYFFHIFLELGLYGGIVFMIYIASQLIYFFRSNVGIRVKCSVFALFLLSASLSSSIAFATLCVPFWLTLWLIQQSTSVPAVNLRNQTLSQSATHFRRYRPAVRG
ncbi:MAG: O-antigen ligase domain-containing protein [Nevskiaceae bacterium]|nr:MAG: O-antigen ligase domain-containing protein [Nevskiaceae bacterium]